MANILIIDDDRTLCTQLGLYMEEMGHSWDSCETLGEAIHLTEKNTYDLIFLDVFLPDASGLSGISTLKQSPSRPEVIIITGHGDPDSAEIALTNGAWHYIQKPPVFNTIKLLVERALEYRLGRQQFLNQRVFKRDFIIGNDIKLLTCLEQTARAAVSQGNVLLIGETGTGKELFAKAVHINSLRSQKEFVVVDCTNITPTLASSLLFGHTRGTYTGADKDKAGLVAQAHQGTLFLDEVGDLPLETQKSLLRVLQEKKYRPLGAKKEINCDFRVVSATNKDLTSAIKKGEFREDLYFRLSMFSIKLPPLRERPGDISILAEHHIKDICHQNNIKTKEISKEFIDTLLKYHWPGNIRELINILQTAVSNAINEPVLYPHALPVEMRIYSVKDRLSKNTTKCTPEAPLPDTPHFFNNNGTLMHYKDFQEQMECRYINHLLKSANGDIHIACRLSGLSRARIYQILKKHGIKGIRGVEYSPEKIITE